MEDDHTVKDGAALAQPPADTALNPIEQAEINQVTTNNEMDNLRHPEPQAQPPANRQSSLSVVLGATVFVLIIASLVVYAFLNSK